MNFQNTLNPVAQGIQDALLHRMAPQSHPMTGPAQRHAAQSLLEMGRQLLEMNGTRTEGMSRLELSGWLLSQRGAGSMGSSDLPSILANVANKRLRSAYEENPGTYTLWARRAPNARDFKAISAAQLSAMPDLLQTNEAGEIRYGSLSDASETYNLLSYGRIVSMTRQALINDDLRAFSRLIEGFAAAARRLENRLVYAQLTANGTMSDGTALFHANHGNLTTGAGSALSATGLSDGRKAMRLQKGLQGEELNLAPAFLIVPASQEQTAYQLTSAQYTPAKPGDINEFRQGGRSSLLPVVEPLLDGTSATRWYLAAASSQVDTVEYCYLDGADGPVVDNQAGFDTDGVSFRCRHDFAAKAVDWRGLYRADGA
ncbi:MAG: Mu-like prophage major head subunit gpT family protein [Burkholderiales bacterium]|jgi:hypothetical protein|nr:Mu-like prophage major head subunit gpT family protein [Burkholderiales bacterium]